MRYIVGKNCSHHLCKSSKLLQNIIFIKLFIQLFTNNYFKFNCYFVIVQLWT